ncbi:MAG: hypothetical protein ACLGG0_05840 [Bacteriovoracia bacterium]
MTKINLFFLLLIISACGKIEQVQESFIGLTTNNSLTMVDVKLGALYRNDPTQNPNGYDYINFGNTQYRIGNMTDEVRQTYNALPRGTQLEVYFKGKFAKRAGVSTSNPSVDFDVIDLEGIAKK